MALILVVDDEAAICQLVRRIIEPAGHTVIEASNGRLALSLLRQGQQVDLVITDIVMPDIEGIEMIREIRREHPGVGILAMSGESGTYLYAALKLGADAVLSKPFRANDLVETVSDLLA